MSECLPTWDSRLVEEWAAAQNTRLWLWSDSGDGPDFEDARGLRLYCFIPTMFLYFDVRGGGVAACTTKNGWGS